MYFFIDNSDEQKIILSIWLNNKMVQEEFETDKYILLGAIDEFKKRQGFTEKDWQGILVVMGKGRFTATRIAVTVANTLALSLNIPVAGIKDFSDNWQDKIAARKPGEFVSAEYGGEANIGTSKTK